MIFDDVVHKRRVSVNKKNLRDGRFSVGYEVKQVVDGHGQARRRFVERQTAADFEAVVDVDGNDNAVFVDFNGVALVVDGD